MQTQRAVAAHRAILPTTSAIGPLRNFFGYGVAAAALVALLGGTAQRADATVTTGTIPVSATILDACGLTTNPLPFGLYSDTAIAIQTTVTVNCTLGGLATLTANVGANGGANYQRNMINATTDLPYNIYLSAAHTTIWGDGTNGTGVIAVVGTGLPLDFPVYGNLPASLVTLPGLYTDTVLVTLTY